MTKKDDDSGLLRMIGRLIGDGFLRNRVFWDLGFVDDSQRLSLVLLIWFYHCQ